ncbi:acetate kinase [Campylobacter sp. Cr9]|uniref:acetate kinase n=1 Tax=unclassified Campylobacter TaxID=2593542 RepID=UPI001EFAB397|nr:acetate kinase [Campylobacter sp. RM5004]MBZ7985758.1 acetate kinase [Campylobacter sp. Cr9]ULO01438.1 acetate kinase [Campylobacter sp. RM5004]
MKKVLVLNAGSSSLKFQLFFNEDSVASGLVEQIGESNSRAKIKFDGKELEHLGGINNHEDGLKVVRDLFAKSGLLTDFSELAAVGHRVVHGGDKFIKATLVDDNCLKTLDELVKLAPLHNPANISGIKTIISLAPSVKNVAVFDTAFHQTMPEIAYRYAIANKYYEEDGVRRYGFHGTSHEYVTREAEKFLGVQNIDAITAHLGNGASISAIKGGKCVDTSMGLTPLEGLMMGTRCGDIDAGALFYLAYNKGLSVAELDKICNKQSGLLGICGANDMREIEENMQNGDEKAKLAFDMFCYRIAKYIGSYLAVTPAKALIFTAGIGENDDLMRAAVCKQLAHLGFSIDEEKNAKREKVARNIAKADSKYPILVIPTNEELSIAKQTLALI